MDSVRYLDARRIQREERDVALHLDEVIWPNPNVTPPPGWEPVAGGFTRIVEDATGEQMDQPIEETLLRFPSAPLHGWQRFNDYHVKLTGSENFHTYRVFADPDYTGSAKHIFLMNNGLNETQTMGLYYQLASHLITKDPAAVCVLRPFPGHLTRFPFQAFAETPLDRYLWDGSYLFRQFLRYMIETQWFLSAVVRRSTYRSLAGANLLAEDDDPEKSRLEAPILAVHMERAWRRLYDESAKARTLLDPEGSHVYPSKDPPKDDQIFVSAIEALRGYLGLSSYAHYNGELSYPRSDGKPGDDDEEPSLHVVGYSLGGFTAQSIFMSWPFLVASCVTLLSGGALRELSPTAFAHPEEWQTVLRSLRYELDDAMMSGLYDVQHVAGIEQELFLYLKRTFYEVFQQEYRGSFQSRLAAYRQRMLFVVGGNDPIVQTRSVLDSGPPGGINMVAIGGLGHFLDAKAQDEEEQAQRSFWLPEVARLIDSFGEAASAKQREERPFTWLNYEMQFVAYPQGRAESKCQSDESQSEESQSGGGRLDEDQADKDPVSEGKVTSLNAAERLAIGQDGALPGELFERCLEDLLARQADAGERGGLLFILRNEIPTMLLDDLGIYEHAAMLNHNDVAIARYAQGVRWRREALVLYRERIAVILPWNARRIMGKMDFHKGYPTQAEAAKGRLPGRRGTASTQLEQASWAAAPSADGLTANGQPRCEEERRDNAWQQRFQCCEDLALGKGKESLRMFDGRKAFAGEPVETALTKQLLESPECDKALRPNLGVPSSLPDCWIWMSRSYLHLEGGRELTIEKGINQLPHVVPGSCESPKVLENHLRKDDLRMITVSRARYNPRYRGRIVADPRTAMNLIYHVALCLTASEPATRDGFEAASSREELAVI